MIVTDLEHATGQIALTPPMKRSLAFLQQARGRELELGRIEIDRNRVYALVQAYETAITNTPRFEAHRRYIDVHYIVSGVEGVGLAPTQLLRSPTAYDEPGDVWFGTASLGRNDINSPPSRANSGVFTD